MVTWQLWDLFIQTISNKVELTPTGLKFFKEQFQQSNINFSPEESGKTTFIKSPQVVKKSGGIDWSESDYSTNMTKVYGKFGKQDKFKNLNSLKKDKAEYLLPLLITEYLEWVKKFDSPPPDDPLSPDTINWRDICRRRLEQKLTTNPLFQHQEAQQNRDDIYVNLALVKRTKREKPPDVKASSEGSHLYEPLETEKTYQHEQFLRDIIEKGQGNSQGKRIALIGEPGAGKTTLLTRIGNWLLDQELGLPIWVSLGALAKKGELSQLEAYLLETLPDEMFSPQEKEEAKQELETTIKANPENIWLLLDGVDEIASSSQILEYIERQLGGWLVKCRVILTCRLNLWGAGVNHLSEFETYRLLDYDYPQQVHEFIDNFFSSNTLSLKAGATPTKPAFAGFSENASNINPPLLVGEGQGERSNRLKQALEQPEKAHIRDLIKNPLRLTLLCGIWLELDREDLPDTQAELYDEYVRYFYLWKSNRFGLSPSQQRKLNQALGKLALKAIDQKKSRFLLEENFVQQELGDKLFNQATQIGWLNKLGKYYAFYHATFQEYFAAKVIPHWSYFLNHFNNPKKAPLSKGGLGGSNPNNGNLGGSNLNTAAWGGSHPYTGSWEDLSYRIFDPKWKQVILLWLGRQDIKDEDKEAFIEALVNFDDGVNNFYCKRAYFLAAAGVGQFKQCSKAKEIVNQIIKWGFGYFDEKRQKWTTFLDPITTGARKILPETRRDLALTALNNILDDPKRDNWTPLLAAYNLGNIDSGNQKAIAALSDLLDDPKRDDWTRLQAAECLGKIDVGNQKAIATLIEIRDTRRDLFIHIQATACLGEIPVENRQASATLSDIAVENQIADLIDILNTTEDELTRLQAAESLGRIDVGNPRAIAALIDILKTTESKGMGGHVADGLPKILDTPENYLLAVSRLKDYMTNEVYQKNSDLYENCFNVIWKCAENLPYPDFYQAWYPPTEEVQTLNLAQLPQLLRQHLDSNFHLIFIDSCQFTDEPATDIYSQMRVQNCPPFSQGIPDKIAKLKLYWQELNQHPQPLTILILWTDPTHAPLMRFSPELLRQINTFSGSICLISDEVIEGIRLQQFREQDPDLIDNVVKWIERINQEGL